MQLQLFYWQLPENKYTATLVLIFILAYSFSLQSKGPVRESGGLRHSSSHDLSGEQSMHHLIYNLRRVEIFQ